MNPHLAIGILHSARLHGRHQRCHGRQGSVKPPSSPRQTVAPAKPFWELYCGEILGTRRKVTTQFTTVLQIASNKPRNSGVPADTLISWTDLMWLRAKIMLRATLPVIQVQSPPLYRCSIWPSPATQFSYRYCDDTAEHVPGRVLEASSPVPRRLAPFTNAED